MPSLDESNRLRAAVSEAAAVLRESNVLEGSAKSDFCCCDEDVTVALFLSVQAKCNARQSPTNDKAAPRIAQTIDVPSLYLFCGAGDCPFHSLIIDP